MSRGEKMCNDVWEYMCNRSHNILAKCLQSTYNWTRSFTFKWQLKDCSINSKTRISVPEKQNTCSRCSHRWDSKLQKVILNIITITFIFTISSIKYNKMDILTKFYYFLPMIHIFLTMWIHINSYSDKITLFYWKNNHKILNSFLHHVTPPLLCLFTNNIVLKINRTIEQMSNSNIDS